MNLPIAVAGDRRDEILTSLARLYSLREEMRNADKPVTVHCLSLAIKIRTQTLRELETRGHRAEAGVPALERPLKAA